VSGFRLAAGLAADEGQLEPRGRAVEVMLRSSPSRWPSASCLPSPLPHPARPELEAIVTWSRAPRNLSEAKAPDAYAARHEEGPKAW